MNAGHDITNLLSPVVTNVTDSVFAIEKKTKLKSLERGDYLPPPLEFVRGVVLF